MQLGQFVAPRGAQSALAKALACNSQLVWQWASRVRQAPVERCPAIEQATKGAVTCEELRADVCWVRVPDTAWPWHPQGRPLIDVTAQATESERAAA